MPPKWISANERLQNGINLINALPANKFQLLLSHIAAAESNEIFTEEELKKLQESLKLNESNLQLLIQSISYIFKQSCKVVIKPTVLQKDLTDELRLDQDKAEEFTRVWSNEMKKELGDFSKRKRLENINWELNIQAASSFGNKEAIPNARLLLNLANADDDSKKDKVILEVGEQELLQMYNTMEAIQSKLDIINSKQ